MIDEYRKKERIKIETKKEKEIYMINGGFWCILGAHFEMEVSYIFHKVSGFIKFVLKLHFIFAKVVENQRIVY
jgi:hypothetical protein